MYSKADFASIVLTVSELTLIGAPDGSLFELFNKILRPVLVSSKALLLYYAIENYINGVEKEN